MNRVELMRELEYLLSDIAEEEKADALAYYRDYLEEAGEAEAEAIREFGSPERIAAIIRMDLQSDMKENGEFTERGFEDERFREPNFQVVKRLDLPEAGARKKYGADSGEGRGMCRDGGESQWQEYADARMDDGRQSENRSQSGYADAAGTQSKKKGMSGWKIGLIAVLILAASPILLSVGSGVFGILTALLVTVVVLLVFLAILTVAFLIGGIAVFGIGLLNLFVTFADGLFLTGTGLVMVACGLVGLVVSVRFYGKVIPWAFRGIINGINRLIHRGVKRG